MEKDIYLDPREFYSQEMDTWESLWDNSLSLYSNTENILKQAVMVPNKRLMLPILTSYILIPSKWAKILPILFSFGAKGSGKSTTAIFASKMHGFNQVFSATDTFASIRNSLDMMRWIDPKHKELEKEGAILAWDNIHAGTLERDERIYQMLLFGYSRASDKICIASTDGTNKEFYVFSPKIISSIDDLHLMPRFEELHRRLLVIPHKPWHDFTLDERKEYEGFDIHSDRLDLDSIHWDGIEDKFFAFWNSQENCKNYARYRTLLTRKNSKFHHSIKPEQWIISIDLIVTGLVTGAWNDIREAIAHMEEYWTYANKHIFNKSSAMMEHMAQFIKDEVGVQLQVNQQLIENGQQPMKIVINPTRLKQRINYHRERGELDINPQPKDVIDIMSRLGWRLTSKGWEQK